MEWKYGQQTSQNWLVPTWRRNWPKLNPRIHYTFINIVKIHTFLLHYLFLWEPNTVKNPSVGHEGGVTPNSKRNSLCLFWNLISLGEYSFLLYKKGSLLFLGATPLSLPLPQLLGTYSCLSLTFYHPNKLLKPNLLSFLNFFLKWDQGLISRNTMRIDVDPKLYFSFPILETQRYKIILS